MRDSLGRCQVAILWMPGNDFYCLLKICAQHKSQLFYSSFFSFSVKLFMSVFLNCPGKHIYLVILELGYHNSDFYHNSDSSGKNLGESEIDSGCPFKRILAVIHNII